MSSKTSVHLERKFEAETETALLANGYVKGNPAHFNATLGFDTESVLGFINLSYEAVTGKIELRMA